VLGGHLVPLQHHVPVVAVIKVDVKCSGKCVLTQRVIEADTQLQHLHTVFDTTMFYNCNRLIFHP